MVDESLRILMVSNWFPPIASGSSFYALSLAKALTELGHKVCVVTIDWGTQDGVEDTFPFPVYRLPVTRIPKLPIFYNIELIGKTFSQKNRRLLAGIISDFKPDILHHVNHIFDMVYLTNWASRKFNIPVVGSITTIVQHEKPFIQMVMSAADKIVLGLPGVEKWDGIVSLDQNAHDYVTRIYGPHCGLKSEVIPFSIPLKTNTVYENHSTRPTRPQILYAGHIHPFRNPEKLVEAFPMVLEKYPDAQLTMVGRAFLSAPIDAAHRLGLTSDQIRFLGEISHEELIDLYKQSHVFAAWMTGRYKSLGTAPMEAMLCEVPVVTDIPSDLFGKARLVDGENIILVNSLDTFSIAEGIIRLLEDEELRQKVGVNGRRYVRECLSWPVIAGQVVRFYQKIIRQGKKHPVYEIGK